jgi:ComF family protein
LQLLTKAALGQDCALCGARAAALVCADCEADLPRDAGRTEVVAAFAYRFPIDRLVQRFKGAGDLAIGRWLASRLLDRVRHEPRPDIIVVPPLTPRRLRERGFNQSLQLARVIGSALHVRCARTGLRKLRETPPQHWLGRRARQRNLRGAFACTLDLRGRRVAIVDDVVTTGATLRAIALALRSRGAKSVAYWAVARAPLRGR